MTGYPEAIGFLVELLHHLNGEIDVDTLLRVPLTARSGNIKHLNDGITVIKTAIELRAVHKAGPRLLVNGVRKSAGSVDCDK